VVDGVVVDAEHVVDVGLREGKASSATRQGASASEAALPTGAPTGAPWARASVGAPVGFTPDDPEGPAAVRAMPAINPPPDQYQRRIQVGDLLHGFVPPQWLGPAPFPLVEHVGGHRPGAGRNGLRRCESVGEPAPTIMSSAPSRSRVSSRRR
jgi:hypothetical protein